METAIFSAVWQKPSKAKEILEKYRRNKSCVIWLYIIPWRFSAGNLGNR
jgi:hypothetical protein